MNDSLESSTQGARQWLLLIHQLPPKPDYIRVKVRRRLQRLGAALLKSSVYVLPDTEENLEDFQWLANEIVADGGDATIVSAAMLSGVTDRELESMFEMTPAPAEDGPADSVSRGTTWVTREGVFIDRIASAWLIRRFIDPDAEFKFVPARGYKARPGEMRFDMYSGEFTHSGDRCTFETLAARFRLDDPALRALGEIVHDIDCKDDKFGRDEAAGVLAVVQGIALATKDDAERIKRGSLVFDGLYGQLAR
ncbi:MAG: chromate resistance protein ChrB domain-containing protein [Gemmatimonadaceae bacterium]